MTRPAVLFGGPSPEHDVSILTGLLAARALATSGTAVDAIYWSKSGDFFEVDAGLEGEAFLQGVPAGAREVRLAVGEGFVAGGGGFGRKARPLEIDALVNCCHGGPGEDGTLQGLLDLAGIRYTGPSVAGAALGMDKLAFASVCERAGLPHLPVVAVDPTDPGDAPFDGPFIVKPRFGGSSIGIETFEAWDDVAAFVRAPNTLLRRGGVVEPFRPDAEDVEIAIRRFPELELSAISRVEKKGAIFDYRNKYVPGEGMTSAGRETPARLPGDLDDAARRAATKVATLAVVRGVARLDFLLVGEELFVNEINTVPGSLSKHLWVEPEIAFATLLTDMVREATTGPGPAYSSEGADGSILRSAASIAAKLG
ncbi:MAG TPA: hypothetical protein VF230_15370 [Acidimicrobiales bacterium]